MHFASSNLSRFLYASALATALLFQPHAQAAGPIHVMLLDGESGGPYHNWKLTTPVLKKELEETGLFQVDVVTAPAATHWLIDEHDRHLRSFRQCRRDRVGAVAILHLGARRLRPDVL